MLYDKLITTANGDYMARPIVLVKESVLAPLYAKFNQGVPVLKIIRQEKLDGKITAPTLTKLFRYMEIAANNRDEVATIIYNSLFPIWINKSVSDIELTPNEYMYIGKMPLGKWTKRNP
jgi:hypothetical protein